MAVPDDLLEILICLECRASLTDEGDHLACTGCSLRYPIRDGVPIMLREEAYREGEH